MGPQLSGGLVFEGMEAGGEQGADRQCCEAEETLRSPGLVEQDRTARGGLYAAFAFVSDCGNLSAPLCDDLAGSRASVRGDRDRTGGSTGSGGLRPAGMRVGLLLVLPV